MYVKTDEKETNASPCREQQPLDGASKILLDAANLIEERGWIQRKARSPRGYCMFGAIWNVDTDASVRLAAENRLNASCGVGSIAAWNDRPGRTKDEVVAKLRAVALQGA